MSRCCEGEQATRGAPGGFSGVDRSTIGRRREARLRQVSDQRSVTTGIGSCFKPEIQFVLQLAKHFVSDLTAAP